MHVSKLRLADSPGDIVSAKTDDGQVITFRMGSVVAIVTAEDRKTSTIMLDGGMRTTVKGSGEGFRKKVFGAAPAEVQAAIRRQTAKKKRPDVAAA